MLKWIVGSKVDHPLADPKQARALVSELPPHDYVNALEEITRWLESLNETEGFRLERVLEIAELLDSAARAHQRKLVQEYLATPRGQKVQENRLWTCGHKFARALGATYLAAIDQFQSNPGTAGAQKKEMPVVIARALRTLAMQVKWTMLRYSPYEARLWSSIGTLHEYAARNGFAGAQLAIYPGPQGTSTIEQDFLRVLMLCGSSADVLPPVKQDIAERAVAAFSSGFRLSAEPFEGALYAFDPALDRPPVRLVADAPMGAPVTYFGPGEAPGRLAQVIATIESTRAIPTGVNLGAQYPVDAVLQVLKHLALFWSDKPPARASERRATTARLTVVPGFSAVLDELERGESDALNFSVSAAECWIVENVSQGGYGALVPAAMADSIRVGELLGVQLESEKSWGVGIIRRVVRDEQRQYHVGIQMVSRAVTLVRMSHGDADAEYALLLAGAPDANGEIGLVMRAGRFDSNVSVHVIGRSKTYRFDPARLMDAGDDFDWAMFRVRQAS